MLNEKQFIDVILKNKSLYTVIHRAEQLGLNNWYVGAGILCQTYWNYLHGFPLESHIRDIDLVYFDREDLSWEKENDFIQKADLLFKDLNLKIDLKNQARVHLWYPQKFGYKIKPYISIKSAIDTWPTTATAMGLTKISGNSPELYAAFGIKDAVNMIVRPNKAQITREIYLNKANAWKINWPDLTIISWEQV